MMKTSCTSRVRTDPLRDIEIIDLELIMADIEMVQRRIDKAAKAGKSGDKACLHEADVFRGLLEHLNDGKSARTYDCSDEDRALLETSDLLSIKPVIYAANLDENTFAAGYEDCKYYQQVRDLAASQGAQVLPICAKVEQEIGELEPDERAMFLEELGIEESGLDRLIQCSYSLLGLISLPDVRRAMSAAPGRSRKRHEGAAGRRQDPLGLRARLHPRRDRRLRRPDSLRQHGRRQGEGPASAPRARTM